MIVTLEDTWGFAIATIICIGSPLDPRVPYHEWPSSSSVYTSSVSRSLFETLISWSESSRSMYTTNEAKLPSSSSSSLESITSTRTLATSDSLSPEYSAPQYTQVCPTSSQAQSSHRLYQVLYKVVMPFVNQWNVFVTCSTRTVKKGTNLTPSSSSAINLSIIWNKPSHGSSSCWLAELGMNLSFISWTRATMRFWVSWRSPSGNIWIKRSIWSRIAKERMGRRVTWLRQVGHSRRIGSHSRRQPKQRVWPDLYEFANTNCPVSLVG